MKTHDNQVLFLKSIAKAATCLFSLRVQGWALYLHCREQQSL